VSPWQGKFEAAETVENCVIQAKKQQSAGNGGGAKTNGPGGPGGSGGNVVDVIKSSAKGEFLGQADAKWMVISYAGGQPPAGLSAARGLTAP
jgi:hypothetical protein